MGKGSKRKKTENGGKRGKGGGGEGEKIKKKGKEPGKLEKQYFGWLRF